MKVYSLYSSYLNVLIKTLQLQAKVENIKNAEIRKLALFQWGGAISPACQRHRPRRLFQWGPSPQEACNLPHHACNTAGKSSEFGSLPVAVSLARWKTSLEKATCAHYCRLVGKRMRRRTHPSACCPARSERSNRWRKAQLATRTSMRSNTALRTSWARVGARKTVYRQSPIALAATWGREGYPRIRKTMEVI